MFPLPDENAAFFQRKAPGASVAFILTNRNRRWGVRRRTPRAVPRARVTFALALSQDHATHVGLQLATCVAARIPYTTALFDLASPAGLLWRPASFCEDQPACIGRTSK